MMGLDYTGQGWSGSALAGLASTTRLLAFAPRQALPRPYTVNVVARLVGDAAIVSRSLLNQSLLVTYTNRGVSKTIAVDIAAGGAIFDIVADSITIDVVNAGTAILAVQGAITRYVEGTPWRNARRTLTVPAGAGPFALTVPQHAKSFTIHNRNAGLAGEFRDANNVALGTFGIPATQNIFAQDLEIPIGTNNLNVIGTVAALLVVVFEIGT